MSNSNETTTRFRVDISDLKRNIQEANRQIRLANSEFRAASSGMEDWAHTADGVSEKIRSLERVLDSQKSILRNYQRQLELIRQEYGENSQEAQEMQIRVNNYRTTVNNTERDLNNYRARLEEIENAGEEAADETNRLSNATRRAGEEAEDAGDGFTILKGALANIAADLLEKAFESLTNAISGAYEAALELDEGYDTIITKTGATGEALDDLTEQMDDVFTSLPTTAEEAGTAIGEVNTRFGLTGDTLEELSKQFIQFATINGTDLNNSIDEVDSIMKKFGVDTKETGKVLGLLTSAGQRTGISMDALYASLDKNGATLKELGLDLDESVNLLAQFESSGVDSATALAALKKAQANATKEGKTLNQSLRDSVKEIKGAKDKTEALQIATELFGAKGAAEMTQAINEGRFSIENLNDELDNYATNVQDTYESTLDPWDSMTMTMNELKKAGSDIATSFLGELQPSIESAAGAFKEWAESVDWEKLGETAGKVLTALGDGFQWIVDNKNNIIAALLAIATGMGAYVAYTTALTVMTEGWKALTIVTKLQAAAQAALNAVMSANQIGLVIAAITGLVAVIIYLWNTSEEFRNFWISVWNTIKLAVDSFVTDWKGGIDFIKTSASEAWTNIKQGFSDAWNGIKETWGGAKEFFGGIWDGIKEIFGGVGEWFSQTFQGASDAVSEIFGGLVGIIKAPINTLIDGINKFIDGLNKIEIPDWVPGVGGKGMNIPKISKLETGGVLEKGQMGFLEGNGAEAVVPLEKNKKWISATAKDLRKSMETEGIAGASGGVTYNFTQNNTSPKALSRLELYRQTKNQLNFVKEV